MKMLTCNKKYFNMVEIVLALAVVSIAIVSLMGVLPVALKASKNSVADPQRNAPFLTKRDGYLLSLMLIKALLHETVMSVGNQVG